MRLAAFEIGRRRSRGPGDRAGRRQRAGRSGSGAAATAATETEVDVMEESLGRAGTDRAAGRSLDRAGSNPSRPPSPSQASRRHREPALAAGLRSVRGGRSRLARCGSFCSDRDAAARRRHPRLASSSSSARNSGKASASPSGVMLRRASISTRRSGSGSQPVPSSSRSASCAMSRLLEVVDELRRLARPSPRARLRGCEAW